MNVEHIAKLIMAAVLLLLFTMLKLSAGLKYEVIRTRSGSDKIIFKTNKTGICTKYGATYFAKTEETTTCICSPGTTFYSVHSELPACHSSSANNLGCGCVGKCMSLITAELSMNRIFPKPVVWCNQTKPRYTIKKWTNSGWKNFVRADDMSITYSVENDKGVLRFRWKVDGFSVISSYSGNLFFITAFCGVKRHCFLAKSPSVTKQKSIAPPYEIIRQQSEPDKVVFKTSQSDICKTYGATYFAKTVDTITCVCSPGTTFYSVHTELPACHSSSADNLGGCGCIGKCMGLITPELSMNRIFPSPVVWCNRTQPKYIIKKWAMDGWKDFSRPNDMSLTYSVEEGKGVLRFRWKVDGFSVISSYSGNLFFITAFCGVKKNCFLAKSPGKTTYNRIQPITKVNPEARKTPSVLESTKSSTIDAKTVNVQRESPQKDSKEKSQTFILIAIVSGVFFLIIILAILVVIIYRKYLTSRNTQTPLFNQIPSTITAKEIYFLSREAEMKSFQNTTNPYSYVYSGSTRPVPPPRIQDPVRKSTSHVQMDEGETALYEVIES